MIAIMASFLMLLLSPSLMACGTHDASMDGCTTTCSDARSPLAIDFSTFVAERDATFVAKRWGWGFFANAIKAVAVWGGVKLTKWVMGKISRQASAYSGPYRNNPGVLQAADHWDDLMKRSGSNGCHIGPEPDHEPGKPGFQDAGDCPMCSKELASLRY
jgi:hypothetical protein